MPPRDPHGPAPCGPCLLLQTRLPQLSLRLLPSSPSLLIFNLPKISFQLEAFALAVPSAWKALPLQCYQSQAPSHAAALRSEAVDMPFADDPV